MRASCMRARCIVMSPRYLNYSRPRRARHSRIRLYVYVYVPRAIVLPRNRFFARASSLSLPRSIRSTRLARSRAAFYDSESWRGGIARVRRLLPRFRSLARTRDRASPTRATRRREIPAAIAMASHPRKIRRERMSARAARGFTMRLVS